MSDTNEKNIVSIITTVGLVLVIVILCAYIIYNSPSDNNKSNANSMINKNECPKVIDLPTSFDKSNNLNNSDTSYRLTNSKGISGISVEYDLENKNYFLSIQWDIISNIYGIKLNGQEPTKLIMSNLYNNLADIYVGRVGQEKIGDTILFLMDDGTVQYIPVYKALTTDSIKSYGKLSGLSDVVKFVTANVTSKKDKYLTVLAQKKDGTFIDLKPILDSTGNY